MASCDIQELIDDGKCYFALNAGEQEVVKLALLCRILQTLDPLATCNIQDLLDDGKCFFGLSSGAQEVTELQLLCDISAAISGALPLSGAGDPNVLGVVGTQVGQTYFNTLSDATYHWNGTLWV